MNFVRKYFFSSEETIDLDNYILGEPIYSGTVFDGIKYEKYITKASKLVPNIMTWAYNRNVDEAHVNMLHGELRKMTYPHFVGAIKIARSESDKMNLRLIDGQHRIIALSRLLKEDPDFDMDVDVDIYYTEGADISLCELFMRANNNKNVDTTDIPDKKIIDTIEILLQFWPQCIKTDETKSAHRPNIHKRLLYSSLKSVIDKHQTLTHVQLARKIFDMNEKLRTKPLHELFGTNSPSKQKIALYEKARKKDFFLNLDCVFCIEKWVNLL